MYTCIIIDDELLAIVHLKKLLQDYTNINLVRTFTDSTLGMDFLLKNSVDIVFLDIKMPEKNGIDIAKKINPRTTVIFTTAFTRYAMDSYNIGVGDYLLKPIINDRLKTAIDRAIIRIKGTNFEELTTETSKNSINQITIIADRKIHKVDFDDILYVQSLKEYLSFEIKKSSKLMSLGSLKDLIDYLPKEQFAQVSKSFLVNIQQIQSYTATYLVLKNRTFIKIGRVYKEKFFETMKKFNPY